MIFKIHRHQRDFIIVNGAILRDENLSFRAKGLLVYLLGRPEDWRVRVWQLARMGPDGKCAIEATLKELEKQGYIRRSRLRGEDGKLKGSEYHVFETVEDIAKWDAGLLPPQAESSENQTETS